MFLYRREIEELKKKPKQNNTVLLLSRELSILFFTKKINAFM